MKKNDVADRGEEVSKNYNVAVNVGPEAKRPKAKKAKAVRFYRSGMKGSIFPALCRSLCGEENEVILFSSTFPRNSAYKTEQRTSIASRCPKELRLSLSETGIENTKKIFILLSGTVDPSEMVEEEYLSSTFTSESSEEDVFASPRTSERASTLCQNTLSLQTQEALMKKLRLFRL